MTRYFVRTEAGWKENLAAAALGLGVAAGVFYFSRILLSRDTIEATPPPALPSGRTDGSRSSDGAAE